MVHILTIASVLVFVGVLAQPGYSQPRVRNWGLVRRWPFLFSNDPNDVAFYLYPDPMNEDYREKIEISNSTALAQTAYNSSRPLVIIIHGLLSNPSTVTDVINIKNAYLSIKFEANIVMVDHAALQTAHLPAYIPFLNFLASFPSIFNSFRTGKKVAQFVRFLISEKVVSGADQVHMIGLSNGGHIAGHAGKEIMTTTGAKVGRISGLDCPGGQLFPSLLEASDASFVDMTYTAYSMTGYFGRTGHADFYMNGIRAHQPDCRNGFPFTEPYCSHVSSVYYFAKSIRNKNMWGCKCKESCRMAPPECADKVTYGQYAPSSARGDYYVTVTNYQSNKEK